ncbi:MULTISPECIES: M23 family metallopeptidase [unclassified Streptomyces]|uniref:M23 family metallopeptidase n=1 Tax=unclassified Streptomyces TaxID=2593676 RepID=UPI0033E6BC56
MEHDIASAPDPVLTRRRALGTAAALLAGGAMWPAPARAAVRRDHDCTDEYDAEFEDALAAADEEFGEEGIRRLAQDPPQKYAMPLRRTFRVSAAYGVRGDWLAGHHTGIDLAVPQGTPVYAVGAGVVLVAGWSGAYGNAVTVRMPDDHYSLVAHLSRVSVRVGAEVRAGTLLGKSGATGRATGPHLHLEIRARRGYGSDIDPVKYLAGRGVQLL